MSHTVAFEDLATSDLTLETVYLSGPQGNTGADALAKLAPLGNQGGFRYKGSPSQGTVRIVALFTSGTESDWPDELDLQTGIFTYYGDNREPGRPDLHRTQRKGNLLLRDTFAAAHGTEAERAQVPPFLLFEKAAPGRSARFRGLLAPGAEVLTADDDLVAIWRSKSGQRFQNYRAKFTVLNTGKIERAWIDDLAAGISPVKSAHCPESWRAWVKSRSYDSLTAAPTTIIRSKADQLPASKADQAILGAIHAHFDARPHDFEKCAVDIWRMIAPATGICDVTRPSRDGGRDAIGQYQLGPAADPIKIDFALEAKCYAPSNSVGVREMSRLISRLRHRHFGVFVTLSYYNSQVYDEVRSDGHPIALICGRDIVNTLKTNGHGQLAAVKSWLHTNFPPAL
ncbi:restriction endonuclease [Nocardia blacklockiae]|uniref:restriction endonuclease n=1 Tax=Nocardia blacklockiae TaxID=480036 RepID=UPI0018958686|nr:restriction endonuclease [Nocardia blacklockiae]MBF6174436.1 restriction endonuclease [Nocardia blacklockiae]